MSVLWQQWRAAEGTLLVLEGLKQRRAAYAEHLATGTFTYKSVDETIQKTAEVIGRINEIDQLIGLMTIDEDVDDEQASGGFEDRQA
jgi:hypothetical protein